ncbi:MAG TPA: chorismate mutase [Candidatus Omnitrophota bacterium]|nr:chorismate mutase [Candidatus Omnitrophota bacterium]
MTKDLSSLDAVRAEIDRIDDRLHDLLMERTALVERVAAAKAADAGVPLRPGREAQILRRLTARHAGPFPKAALVRIWREIMGALVGLQGPFSMGVFQPERGAGYIELARNHFGTTCPMVVHVSPGHVVRMVADGQTSVGVVPVPGDNDAEPWWLALASEAENLPRVVARLPVIPSERPEPLEALIVARRPHDDTGDDRTLIVVETSPDVSRDRLRGLLATAALEPSAMVATHRRDDSWLHLVEVTGCLQQGDPALATLVGAKDPVRHVSVIGGYPVPLPA